MPVVKRNESQVGVRCFCGHSLRVNPKARKPVICSKCHQPVPMRAIRTAWERRVVTGGS